MKKDKGIEMSFNESSRVKFELLTREIESYTDDVLITPESATLGLSAYLLLEVILKGEQLSWSDAVEISSTCTRNTVSEIRKAVEYNDIENIKIPTKYSYYDEYKASDNPESIARLIKLFDYIAKKPLVQKRLERINPDWLKLQGENFGA